MRNALNKTTAREIRGTFGRWIAIFAIVALGVGFFAGLRITRNAMVHTTDVFLHAHGFYDFRLISTLGLTEEDVTAFAQAEGVKNAAGSVSAAALFTVDEDSDTLAPANFHMLLSDINTLSLTAGRLPTASNECVLDRRYAGEDALGKTIVLSAENEEDTLDLFAHTEYTVVGLADAPYYINFERGTTSIGSGSVACFVYLPPEGFEYEVFTEIFVTLDEQPAIYSEEYDALLDETEPRITALLQERAQLRYSSIVADAQAEIADAKAELADGEAEYKTQRADAEKELADAAQALTDGRAEIEKNRAEIAENEKTLADAQQEIDDQRAALARSEAELAQQKADFEASRPMLPAAVIAQYEAQFSAADAQIAAGKAQLDAAQAEVDDGLAQIAEGKQKLTDAEAELAQGQLDYDEAKAEAEEEFARAEAELADAREKIADAEADVAALEAPDTYNLGRSANTGYVCFENDAQIVHAISAVFPIFFFLVAALVCMTTMTRMVNDQRTQIGTLKALGYGRGAIMKKYIVYSGSAAMLGCIGGYAGGILVFPAVIWEVYGIMYGFADLLFLYDVPLALLSLAVALACSVGTTWLSCRRELSRVPAALMRPKAPKAGKRIFLEYLPFWNRVPFLHKVSIRNILRYKKRLGMMIIGIGGCTALLVTGFGLRDSILGVMEQQFNEIMTYDASVTFTDPLSQEDRTAFADEFGGSAPQMLFLEAKAMDVYFGDSLKSVSLLVTEERDTESFLHLHRREESVPWPGSGEIVLSLGAAESMGIEPGDTVTMRDSDMNEMTVTVSAVFDNYVQNYAIMDPAAFAAAMGRAAEPNTAYLRFADGVDHHEASAAAAGSEGVAAVSVVADFSRQISSMLSSLDYIVWLVVACAAALAFIVLYNLTNINITERIREIATIKVLGFFRGETAVYVFRENLLLTALGALAGLFLGRALHAFVMAQVRIDMMFFEAIIHPASYGISILLTFVFALLVAVFMSGKLNRIPMAESLKSIE